MWRHPSEQEPFPAPPAAPAQNYGYQQQGQGYYFPPPEQAPAQPPFGHFPPAQQVPYPPPPQDWGPQQQQQPDPRGYDLGGYMPADAQAYAPAPTTQYPQHSQHTQHGYGDPDPDFDDMVEDDDEPRRGRRVLMVVAALVGAIGLGGGLAYTYKNFVLTKGNSRPAVIKTADLGPSKVKPIAPGGKEFAHTDRKLLNRLGDDNSQPASAEGQDRGGDERDAPRKVRVIDIKPGEQGSAASASPPAPVVPGLLLDNSGPQPPPGAVRAAPPPPQASAQPPVRAVPPPPVKVVTAPAPAPTADEAPAAAPKQTNQAALPKAAPLKVAVPKSPPPAASPPPQTTGTSGYVAVLSSQKSRMDALKAFADLQQKYGDVLLSRTPDVQEADLSARGLGTMYRLVVGPPGSRDAASGVCSQLKTAGYQGCWVMAY
jgi:hypothetical protein